jgi:hypothetical protein
VQIGVLGSFGRPVARAVDRPRAQTRHVVPKATLVDWIWGGLQPEVITVYGSMGGGQQLTIDLSDDQLIALERARGEDDVILRLDLKATLLQPPAGTHPVADEQATLRIPRHRWLQLLDQAGTEVGIVIRVRSPLTDPDLKPAPAANAKDVASFGQATGRLRQARAELRDGQSEHCIATCRKVLENVALLAQLPDAKSLTPAVGQRTQDERWAAIYHAVKSMTHAAHHDDTNTSQFTWTRADAEAILAMTAGLLTRYTDAIRDS